MLWTALVLRTTASTLSGSPACSLPCRFQTDQPQPSGGPNHRVSQFLKMNPQVCILIHICISTRTLGRHRWSNEAEPSTGPAAQTWLPFCAAGACPAIPSGSGYGFRPGPSASGFRALSGGDTFHSGTHSRQDR